MAGIADMISAKLAAAVIAGKGLKLSPEETRTLSEVVQMMAGLREELAELRAGLPRIKDGLRTIAWHIHNEIPDGEILARALDSYTVSGPKAAALETLAELLEQIRAHDNAVARLELRDLDWELTSF
jgi:hypothetical protein